MFNQPRNISYLVSFSFHLLLALLFLFVKMQSEEPTDEYVLVGFGSGIGLGSPGGSGGMGGEQKEQAPVVKKNDEDKKIDLPKSRHTDNENIITKTDKKKEKDETTASNVKSLIPGDSKNKGNGAGFGDGGEGGGGFGFALDFGGKGKRRIYSYSLPEYPEGVSKEIDVRLRFTILPDGTVANIFPLIKADARLESTAINSLRQWRFEPLPTNAKQAEQIVVITFPYRLR